MQDKKITRAKKVIDILRNHYGLGVGGFANKLGVGASTISTWASRDKLDEDLIFRICEGVSYDFLLTGEGDPFPLHVKQDPPAYTAGDNANSFDVAFDIGPESLKLFKALGTNPDLQSFVERLLQLKDPNRWLILRGRLEEFLLEEQQNRNR